MSNHQKGGGVAELVGPLLKRLILAKEQVPENSEMEKIIEQMSIEVVKIKDILDSREKLDKELAGCLGKIERQLDPLMDRQPCVKSNSEMKRQEDWRLQSIKKGQKDWRLRQRDTEEWMDHHQLPPELKKRVRHFVQVKWFATRGVEEESILHALPSDIRRDVQRHLCLDVVRHVPLFSEMDEQMVVAICDRLVSCLCPEGTYMAREGDPVNEMLFIIRGTLESNTTNGGRSNFFNSIRLSAGAFCGEELLTSALMSLMAVAPFALPAEDLKFVVNQFRRLHSRSKLENTFRFYSHAWRLWAAGFIQAAWHQYKRRKMAERQIDPLMDRQPCVKPNSEMKKATITEVGQSSNQSHQMDQEFRDSNFFNSIRLNAGDFCGEELLTWALMPKTHDYFPTSTRTVKALTEVEAFALPAEGLKFEVEAFAWRVWAAGFIQAAWHQYKRRKMVERQIDPLIDRQPCTKANSEMEKATITEVGQSSNQSHQMDEGSKFQEFRDSLDKVLRDCQDSLAIFPKNVVLRKRFLTYLWLTCLWWPVVDFERIFSDLIDNHVLIPVHREHNKVSKCFTVEPTLHKQLISYHESKRDHNVILEKREEGSWRLFMDILLNIDQRYLDSKDIIDTTNNDVYAVQLGSWHYTTDVHNGVKQTGSEETNLKDHIEVNQTDFLKKLGEYVHYLSLRGISGIVELPASIGQLEYLWVLDLRACHNLEILPQKSSQLKTEWFRHLVVLDISECYLLDYMPKWVCELSQLNVLKGFVVGSLGNKNQSCSLGDLSKLRRLRKLSIRFTIDNLGPEVFRGFNSLNELLVLTITWRQNKEIPTYSLPKNIEKLDIRCYPEAEVLSKLQNPGELTKLKRLYIRGGNLTKIPCHDNWNVEILRLRFLNKLAYPTDWEELKNSFKNLKYVEYVECTKPKNFPNDGHSWHNEE